MLIRATNRSLLVHGWVKVLRIRNRCRSPCPACPATEAGYELLPELDRAQTSTPIREATSTICQYIRKGRSDLARAENELVRGRSFQTLGGWRNAHANTRQCVNNTRQHVKKETGDLCATNSGSHVVSLYYVFSTPYTPRLVGKKHKQNK